MEAETQLQVPGNEEGVDAETAEEGGAEIDQEALKLDLQKEKKKLRKLRRKERKMRPNIRVTVHFSAERDKKEADQTIHVNCGTGQQSIKWLAQVAALQLTKKARPSGYQRQRDSKLKMSGNLLPTSVALTPRGNLEELLVEIPDDERAPIHPRAKIIDVLKNGAHVRLNVQNEIRPTKALLPKGALYERPSWTEVAFTNSDDGRRRSSVRVDVSPMRMSSHGSPDRKARDKQLEMEREKALLQLDENEGFDNAE